MRYNRKAIFGGTLAGVLTIACLLSMFSLHAQQDDASLAALQSYSDQSHLFLSLDEDGNVSYEKVEEEFMEEELQLPEEEAPTTFALSLKNGDQQEVLDEFDSYEEADQAMLRRSLFRTMGDLQITSQDQLRSTTTYSVVNFHTKGANTTDYTEVDTGISGYTCGNYAADAAYLGTSSDGKKVKFRLAGVTGWVKKADVEIVPYSSSLNLSYYAVHDGYLYHYISTNVKGSSSSSTTLMGKAPAYLKADIKYYSYDGHYFYKSYASMIEDYKNTTSTRAENKNDPYYNYYQFLSHRTKTLFTAADFNNRVNKILGSSASAMKNTGSYFIKYQNAYAVNASLMYGVAVNESGWGQSQIAFNKNNLFGHGAVDSNPYYGANGYTSVAYSIAYHAEYYVDKGYADPADWRYYGPHLGDKQSGMNVKYASDPYWGEKAAAQSYYLEIQSGKADSKQYKIGMFESDTAYVSVRKEPSTSATILYYTANDAMKSVGSFPFIILGEKSGTSVNGNTTWYKMQSDGTLNSARTNLDATRTYDFTHDYGYVNASLLRIVANGSNSSPSEKPNDPIEPDSKPSTTWKKGDVDGDGNITASDYVQVKNHVLKKKLLSGNGLKAADVDGDNQITASDYVLIKNDVLGKKKIK